MAWVVPLYKRSEVDKAGDVLVKPDPGLAGEPFAIEGRGLSLVDTAEAVIPAGIKGKFGHGRSLKRPGLAAVTSNLRAIVPRPTQEARP